MVAKCALLLLALVAPVSLAVTPEELESFFYSSSGLDMGRTDARSLALKESPILSQCGVKVNDLKALKDALYLSSALDLSKADMVKNLLPLAKLHVQPDKLKLIYKTLYSSSGVDLSKSSAQSKALELAVKFADPDQLNPLYSVLYSSSGVNLPKADAQNWAVVLDIAGAKSTALKAEYRKSIGQWRKGLEVLEKSSGQLTEYRKYSKDVSLQWAMEMAIKDNLAGLERRYAKDGKLYSSDEFKKYHGQTWMSEWNEAPKEQRVANDSKSYTAAGFEKFYGSTWQSKWTDARGATLMKLADNGKSYTVQEFVDYYKDTWQQKWLYAPELPCVECAPYASSLLIV